MKFLQDKLRTFAKTGETFDLKTLLSLYVFDILGSVAFGRPFGAQERGYEEVLPAINDHLLLAVSWENFLYNYSPRQSVAGLRFPE